MNYVFFILMLGFAAALTYVWLTRHKDGEKLPDGFSIERRLFNYIKERFAQTIGNTTKDKEKGEQVNSSPMPSRKSVV